MPGNKLDALTGLRFFAALGIFIHHAIGNFPFLESWRIAPWDLGVSFFFVLSGFVLTYSYPSLDDGRRFIVARLARIFPLHLFSYVAIFTILPGVHSFPQGPAENLLTIFLLQSWIPAGEFVFAGNGVSWSISVELFFYCLFPLLLWGWSRWWIVFVIGSLAIVGVVAIVAAIGSWGNPKWGQPGLSAQLAAYAFPPSRLFEFVLGILTAKIFAGTRQSLTFKLGGYLALELLALAALYFGVFEFRYFLWNLNVEHFNANLTIGKWVASSGAAPAFAIVIFIFALSQGPIWKLLSSRVFVFLGEISFSIYMMHVMIIVYFSMTLGRTPMVLALSMLTTFAASALTWRYIEMPARRAVLAAHDRASANQVVARHR